MSLSESFSLSVPPQARKPSEAKSVDSGFCGPSRETSTAQLQKTSEFELAIIHQKKEFSMDSLSPSSSIIATGITEEPETSTSPRLQFTNIFDHHGVSTFEASQPNIIHFTESHLPLQLNLSSSGSPSQNIQITVTSSVESQSQSNTSVAPSMKNCSTSLTEQHEDILRRTVEKKTHLFTEYTNFDTLLPYLYEKKLLHTDDCEKVEKLPTQKAKGNHFYTVILPRKGERAYRRLYKCLKKETDHLGHGYLVEILDKALEEQQPPQSSSDSSPTTESNATDGNFHRSSNKHKDDEKIPSFHGVLTGDRHHGLSCGSNYTMAPNGGGSNVHGHIINDHLSHSDDGPNIDSHLSPGDRGRDGCSEADRPQKTRYTNRNSRTQNGCCTIL